MTDRQEKESLRRMLIARRDSTSGDLLKIAAKRIQRRLEKINAYKRAKRIGLYYSIGSEIPTQDIIQELISTGRKVCLPKVLERDLEFREITDFANLEMGSFDIMEPKDRCPTIDHLDVIVVPSVGVSPEGARLGYGQGFYDRFLLKNSTVTISPALEKQVVRGIPQSESDQTIDWIVTEDAVYDTSLSR